MPQGGRLTIQTGNFEIDDTFVRQHRGARPGPCVLLTVRDTGVGMDLETQVHIFEPFYTTKEKGHGTGLGLATVYGIVKQSGGYIWVLSAPGQGSTFMIYLPRTSASSTVAEPVSPAPEPGKERRTILIAEDEEPIRELLSGYLINNGYRILVAKDGVEALELATQHDGPIDLLLTDVMMPGMSGRELAQQLIAKQPSITVLYMSGYTDDVLLRHSFNLAQVSFLQKPFSVDELVHKVQEVLGPVNRP